MHNRNKIRFASAGSNELRDGRKASIICAMGADVKQIDVRFKPIGPALMKLVEQGSSDATELPLWAFMDRSRFWVRVTYLLLVIIGFVGTMPLF